MREFIVGIDEAGRGPLAGPVTVGAVAVPLGSRFFRGIKDSKKLSAKKRREWFGNLKNNSKLKYSVVSISHSVIDKKGISYALRFAVAKCLKKLEIRSSNLEIKLDGSLYAPKEYRQRTIIKGDEKIPVISAASIMAKVTRDRYMVRLAKKYPLYGFEVHKGYGTAVHRALVKKHGLCDIHRRSYCSKLI